MRSLFVLSLAVALVGCGREATFSVRESVEQLHVTHAVPGATLEVVSAQGAVVTSGTVDEQGSLVFRKLAPGEGYVVRTTGKDPESSRRLTVMSVESSAKPKEWYAAQKLQAGFNYLTMRDGTTLSAWVTLPKGKGPFPTVVNYSGYDASRPGKPDPDLEFLCADFPVMCTPPSDASALLAGLLDYATVSVNIRGTGCSGGAYDYFETLQVLDGYDVIEIVAAQDWVRHHQVGMVGLSYPGITQLFVGAAQPPGLAAIAPMSVIGSTDTTLLPGGILNDGFALSWVKNVLSKAVPYGQGWEKARVDEGDTTCAENQLLHSQLIDNVAQARQITYYVPEEHDRFNPSTFVDHVQVPVLLGGAWQDEQTGPYFFLLFDKFTSSPSVKVLATNGVHIEGFSPQFIVEWQAFLELYVAKRKPVDPTRVRNFSPLLYTSFFDTPLALPPSRFAQYESYEAAKAAWEGEPRFQVIFENGAGKRDEPGAPVAAYTRGFTQWPPAETTALTYYLGSGASLMATPPTEATAASVFQLEPTAGTESVLAPGGDIWAKLPNWSWRQPALGESAVFESDQLTEDLALLGTASVDLFINSPVDDADLEVTLTEARADGQELYIQSGWLRASHRKPGPKATPFWPAQTLTQADAAPLPLNEWTEVRVGTAGFAHVLRAGSRVRLYVDTPGGTRSDWRFALKPFPTMVRYGVAHDAARPSKLVLPKLAGVTAGAPTPPCPSLRGQPCRERAPAANAVWP